MSNPAAGWYDDPENPGQTRWWDGSAWAAAGQGPAAPGAPSSPTDAWGSASGGSFGPPPGPAPMPGGQGGGFGGFGGMLGGGYGPQPSNYIVWSVINLMCFCLPLGIVGLIFGLQVNSRYAMGDTAGAADASRKARLFNLIGSIVGGTCVVIFIILFVIGAVHGSVNSTGN